MRSAIEVVLTMKLMEHVKAMLKAEGLLSAFTTVRPGFITDAWLKKWLLILILM